MTDQWLQGIVQRRRSMTRLQINQYGDNYDDGGSQQCDLQDSRRWNILLESPLAIIFVRFLLCRHSPLFNGSDNLAMLGPEVVASQRFGPKSVIRPTDASGTRTQTELTDSPGIILHKERAVIKKVKGGYKVVSGSGKNLGGRTRRKAMRKSACAKWSTSSTAKVKPGEEQDGAGQVPFWYIRGFPAEQLSR